MPNSYVKYTGDGATTDFNVPFLFLSRSHVHILVGGAEVNSGFTWVSDSLIRFSPVVANTVTILFKRVTPISARLVEFQNGSTLNAVKNLDYDSDQLLFLIQELTDLAVDLGVTAGGGDHTLFGTANPSNLIGVDEDVYFNITTNGLWQKVSGSWVFKMFVGAVGTAGGDLSGAYPNPALATLNFSRVTVAGTIPTANTPGLGGVIQKTAGSATTTFTAGAVDTTALGAHAVTNAKLAQGPAGTLKGNLTGSTADEADNTLQVVGPAISPYITQALCQRFESAQFGAGTPSCIVDYGTGSPSKIVMLGASGGYATVNLTTGVLTSGTISGGYSTVTFAAAIYDPTADRIFAVLNDGSKIVSINPNTWAGTTIYTAGTALIVSIVGIPGHAQFVVAKTGVGSIDLYDATTGTLVTAYAALSGSQNWMAIGYDLASDCVYGLANSGTTSSTHIMWRIPRSTFGTGATNATGTSLVASAATSARCELACANGKAFFGIVGCTQGESWDISGGTPVAGLLLAGRFGGTAQMISHPNGYIYMLGAFGRACLFKLDPSTLSLYAVVQLSIKSSWATGDNAGKHLIPGNDGYLYVLATGGGTGNSVMQVTP